MMGSVTAQVQDKATVPVECHAKYKNIIFDLGGVLIDWRPHEFVKRIFFDNNEIQTRFLQILENAESKSQLNKIWLEMDRGALTLAQLAQEISQKFDIPLIYTQKYIEEVYHQMVPLEKGFEILAKVKAQGFAVYILSNFGPEWFERIDKKYDITKHFVGATISSRVGYVKPEPNIFQSLLQVHGLCPEESLFIDDMPINIEAAKSCGIDGIICSDHAYVAQELERLLVLPAVITDVDMAHRQTD